MFPPTRYMMGGATRIHIHNDLYPICLKLEYGEPACIVFSYARPNTILISHYCKSFGHYFFVKFHCYQHLEHYTNTWYEKVLCYCSVE